MPQTEPDLGPSEARSWRTPIGETLRWALGLQARVDRVRSLVVRGFGLCALFATLSAAWQLPGLVGAGGIVPVEGWAGLVPVAASIAGLGSLGLVAGLFAGPSSLLVFVGLWLLIARGGPFFAYQWDALLLETAVVVALWAPWSPWLHRAPPASPIGAWLVRILAFKLMFFAGYVKLASGDPSWADWTALTVHYETQPLPHGLSWWAHQLPVALHQLAVGATLLIELVLPFGLLCGPPGRALFFVGTTVLMAALAATGNYGTFQLLTVLIGLAALDDRALVRLIPGWLASERQPPARPRWRWAVLAGPAVLLTALNVLVMGAQLWGRPTPTPLRAALSRVLPTRIVGVYGLFAVMTTERSEIGLEVTTDGRTWHEVPFLYKPTDPGRTPAWTGAHLPRLDWHLWFVALRRCHARETCFDTCGEDPGLWGAMVGIAEREPAVLGLVGSLPRDEPILGVRAVRWDYRFTDWTGELPSTTWTRRRQGLQCPPLWREGWAPTRPR